MSATPTLARPRAKKDAVEDFEAAATPADVDALVQYARERHGDAKTPDSRTYWLAYWGRLLVLRRERMQRSKVTPGMYRTA